MISKFKIRNSKLFRDSATLLSGNVVGQGTALLAYLVLTRIYSPADYALFNIFYSYIEIFIILSTCKYELAVIVADDETESAAVARFALRLNAWVSAALLALVAILHFCGALPGNFAQLGALVLLIPPMVFLCGTSRLYAALFNRVHRFKTIAVNTTAGALFTALLRILFGLLGMHRAGLPLGTVLGQGAANLHYRWQLHKMGFPKADAAARRAAARRHRNFPLFVAPKDFVNSLSANLPFLWLALWFDKAEVGLFALALTFTFRPVQLLNSAFERVLYARTAEQVRDRRPVAGGLVRFLLAVNAVALPLGVVGWFVAEPLFTLLFGGRWSGCGIYVQTLLPWLLLSLSSTSLSFISNVFSTQRIEFGFFLLLLALRVAAIAVGIHAGSFLLAIRLYAAAGTLVAASLLVWYLVQVRRYELSLRG